MDGDNPVELSMIKETMAAAAGDGPAAEADPVARNMMKQALKAGKEARIAEAQEKELHARRRFLKKGR